MTKHAEHIEIPPPPPTMRATPEAIAREIEPMLDRVAATVTNQLGRQLADHASQLTINTKMLLDAISDVDKKSAARHRMVINRIGRLSSRLTRLEARVTKLESTRIEIRAVERARKKKVTKKKATKKRATKKKVTKKGGRRAANAR